MKKIFKNKAHLASLWVIGGYGASQVLRLGGNLILTRLLVPEFFGIMAIAQVFINGLWFFSDIGLGPGIIRSKRSDDSVFLDTAWTLQVIRGSILWGLTFAIAIPVAKFYDNPILVMIIPVIGLMSLITSLNSTSIFTLNKEIKLGKITASELVSQLCGLLCMILLAYLYRNVWSLIIGSLVNGIIRAVWSHFLDDTTHNRFRLEKESVSELLSFGKWVFVATAMMYLATQADRMLLGKLLPLALFGVYNIAVMFSEMPKMVLGKLSNKVIFPLMTKYVDLPRHEFRDKIRAKRYQLLIPMALLVAIFSSFGDVIIYTLYDQRYHQAGWMLPLLSLGMWPFILNASIDRCFYAVGMPKIPAIGNMFKFIYMIVVVPTMFYSFGVLGGVIAVALNDLPVYTVNCFGLHREKLACFKQDLTITLLLISTIGIFISLRYFLNYGFPGVDLIVK